MITARHSDSMLRRQIAVLRWVLPLLVAALGILYEVGPGRWIHDSFGASDYFNLDIIFYATVAPLVVYIALTRISQWRDDKEQAEHQATASEQRLVAVMAASADAILSLDAEGRIDSWNRGAEMIFGYQASEMKGHPLTLLLGGGEAPEAEYGWLVQEVHQAGFVRGHETTCRDAAGHDVEIELTATSLATDNLPAGMSIILRDITERKHRDLEIRRLNTSLSEQVAERTRELAEKVEQLGHANVELQKLDEMRMEFVSLVSHQIRAPLTNMQGAVERMGSDCTAVNVTCKRMFAILNQQADRLDRLVGDVLNAARLETGSLVLDREPISLLPVVQQVTEQLRARVNQRSIHLPTKPGLPLVFADRERVAEVLVNLLDNADKYSPPSQPIEIDVCADETEVTLLVLDHGKGLFPQDLNRVFDKFYRASSGDAQANYGYGLGLYVCRRLIEAQGGRIWAENRPSGGAVFSFTLPVAH